MIQPKQQVVALVWELQKQASDRKFQKWTPVFFHLPLHLCVKYKTLPTKKNRRNFHSLMDDEILGLQNVPGFV